MGYAMGWQSENCQNRTSNRALDCGGQAPGLSAFCLSLICRYNSRKDTVRTPPMQFVRRHTASIKMQFTDQGEST